MDSVDTIIREHRRLRNEIGNIFFKLSIDKIKRIDHERSKREEDRRHNVRQYAITSYLYKDL